MNQGVLRPKTYCRIGEPKVERLRHIACSSKKTAPISLQTEHLLGLVSAPEANLARSRGTQCAQNEAPQFSWVNPLPRWKRGLDLSVMLLTLPLWLTVMAFIALWIKLTSRGPVFYRQERIGIGGQPFTILKFRSMRPNAETQSHADHVGDLIRSNKAMVKLDCLGDSRLIPGGRWLRAFGLDELPQLFNVLRGEMSLVGPRPCLPAEFERYDGWHKARVCVAPGLTGYWQVSGKNKTSFQQMVELDLQYSEQMSLWFDIAVMIATIPALFLQFLETRNRCSRKTLPDKAPGSVAHATPVPEASGSEKPFPAAA